MKFPITEAELVLAGYKFVLQGRCNGRNCTAVIHWYTTPTGKRMPFSQARRQDEEKPPGLLFAILWEPHFASCPDVRDFRRKT